jgi:Tripartite tricarboxylate transporter family receptor
MTDAALDRPRIAAGRGWARRSGERAISVQRVSGGSAGLPAGAQPPSGHTGNRYILIIELPAGPAVVPPINGSVGAVGGRAFQIQSDKVGTRGALRDAHLYRREHAMKLSRYQFLRLAAGATALPVVRCIAKAQSYPTRPVRLIAGFPAGGGTDVMARLMGQSLSERLGQALVIENRPGANSNMGTEAVVRAAPDGYTLLMVGIANAINATSYDKLNFNFIRDITPVAAISGVPSIMVVHPSFPAKTIPEFIAYARQTQARPIWHRKALEAPDSC